jgi:hypothetical protein
MRESRTYGSVRGARSNTRPYRDRISISAMAAGVTDRVWDMTDVAALIAAQEAPIAKRGPHKKKAA